MYSHLIIYLKGTAYCQTEASEQEIHLASFICKMGTNLSNYLWVAVMISKLKKSKLKIGHIAAKIYV